ncbi:MAG: hypothetical protein NC123_13420 [Butyrivibrio sp.]|nr:hypothetical protein [Acetatifactor muris]MCM1560521.1 hypothetical protein [Butyrivibrio sp.]
MNQAEVRRRQAQAISAVLAFINLGIIARLAGYNGVAYVAAAVEAYAFFGIAVSGGVSDALGRILRLRGAKGQYRNAAAMRRNAVIFQAALGGLGTAVLLLGAEGIAVKLFRTQYSSAILMILAPAVFLRSLSSVLAGYSRGEGAELPAAAADILRQLLILGFSVLFSRMLGNYGDKVSHLLAHANFTSMYGGIGVAIAVTLAEAIVVLLLFLLYRVSRKRKNRTLQDGMRAADSIVDSIRILCGNRGWQTGLQLLAVLFVPLGMMFWQKAGEGSESAAAEYGVYAGGFCMLCGIAVSLIMLFLIPVCANTVSLLRREESRFARNVFQSGVHIGVVHGAFLSASAMTMSEQFGAVFCGGQAALGTKLLKGGAAVVPLAALSLYFARLLILTGKKYIVMGAVAVADVIYVVAVTVLLGAGKAGILSLVYAGLIACGVLCVVLGMISYRAFRQRVDWLHVLVVPVAAACVAGLVGMLLAKVLTPHLGNLAALLVCLILSAALYWAGLLLLRNFREQELEAIPGGKLLNALGQMLRVF